MKLLDGRKDLGYVILAVSVMTTVLTAMALLDSSEHVAEEGSLLTWQRRSQVLMATALAGQATMALLGGWLIGTGGRDTGKASGRPAG